MRYELFSIHLEVEHSVISDEERENLLSQIMDEYDKDEDYVVPFWDGDVNSSCYKEDCINYDALFKPIEDMYQKISKNLLPHNCGINNMWYNVYRKGYSQEIHLHSSRGADPPTLFSGIYFCKYEEDHAPVKFWNPSTVYLSTMSANLVEYSDSKENFHIDSYGKEVISYHPKQGDLIMFPSFLMHSVPIQRIDSKRVTISFNIQLVS